MTAQQFIGRDERMVRRYEYDDRVVIAADLGVADGEAAVDVLDDRAIVVVESGDRAGQFELELPDGDGTSQGFIRNGVVTIEVRS